MCTYVYVYVYMCNISIQRWYFQMNVLHYRPFVHLFDTPFENSPYGHESPGLKACNFTKKRLEHRCFPVNILAHQ